MLAVEDLRRSFGSAGAEVDAVKGLSFSVESGQILGLVGPNGAGKTTTVRMCSTLLRPTSGGITVAGIDAIAHPRRARRHISLVLGGDDGFYQRSSAWRNLLFFADVAGVSSSQRKLQVTRALEAVGLSERAHDPVRTFSKGMKQRLHIARGLLGDPQVILLDEPTNGLDPVVAQEVRALIKELSVRGVAIVLTTHLMSEMEELARDILVIDHGEVQARGTADEIARTAGVQAVTTFETTTPGSLSDLRSYPGIARVELEEFSGRIVGSVSWSSTPHPEVIESLGGIDGLYTRRPRLEESYLAIVGGKP